MTVPDLQPPVWVALIAALVALLVGLIGPVVNARAQKRTIAAQRQMANDDRLWSKRAALYEEILDWARHEWERAEATRKRTDDEGGPLAWQQFRVGIELPRTIQVGLAAYASSHLDTDVRGFMRALAGMGHTAELAIDKPTKENQEVAESYWLDSGGKYEQMAQCISDELAGKKLDENLHHPPLSLRERAGLWGRTVRSRRRRG